MQLPTKVLRKSEICNFCSNIWIYGRCISNAKEANWKEDEKNYLQTRTVSETLCFLVVTIQDDGQSLGAHDGQSLGAQ
jgi:hypothetical protein